MSWWRIGSDWSEVIPGKNHEENHYSGDEPVDNMQELADKIATILKNNRIIPTRAILIQLIRYNQPPAHISRKSKLTLLGHVNRYWKKVDTIYKKTWNRITYFEERQAIADLVLKHWEEKNGNQ